MLGLSEHSVTTVSGGSYYNYFRTYDPSIGRYTQSDPIGLQGGLNTYGYALQNPVRYIDPRGQAAAAGTVVVGGGIILVGGTLVYGACAGSSNPWCEAVRDIGDRCIDAVDDLFAPDPVFNWPLDEGGKEWGRRNGVGAAEGKRRAHNTKKRDPASKAPDVWTVDPDTGDVYDPEGEVQGNLNDDYD